jgi:hypothetical protein
MSTRSSCECGDYRPGRVDVFAATEGAPIACTLRSADLVARAHEFRSAFERLISSERFERGFRWKFSNEPGFAATLCELARREHACCPFVTFTITSNEETVVWETCGPAEAQGVIEVFFRAPRELPTQAEALKAAAVAAGLVFVDDERRTPER